MLSDSAYVQRMMKDVQQLPPEAAAGKEKLYRKFLESDFKLTSREGAVADWAAKQTYIALGNMMTAAALIGIDSCPMEGFEQDPINRILREEGINDGGSFHLVNMVAFGYRVRDPRPKTRRDIGDIVSWVV
ncbi:nitroreductase family protein [Cohnella suwonensis]|uniref:Nitroreductase family protein n=1 Tax=Cohnella suwonensis TaxID=696072 RepID=A0ABW0M0E8_9BACL